MCSRTDDPTQYDQPDPGEGVTRIYDVEYVRSTPAFATARARVFADTTDEARLKAKSLDPLYLNTTRTPRIVR